MHDPKGSGALPARPVELLCVESNNPRVVRFLGAYTGGMLHYTRDGYLPCDGEPDCPKSLHRVKPVWRGWAPVEVFDSAHGVWWPTVLVITEHLEEQLHGRALRGELWGISRAARKGGKGKVAGLFLELGAVEQLRQPFDLLPVLLRAYHVLAMRLGVPNPLPQRLFLSSSEGPVPQVLDEVRSIREAPDSGMGREAFRELLRKGGLKLSDERLRESNGQKGGAKHE